MNEQSLSLPTGCHFEPVEKSLAEVKASSPIRTSLFEREGSMWGSLKRPSLRRPIPWTFKALRQRLGIPEPPRQRTDMVDDCRADDSDFCLEVVEKGLLTEVQMHRAAERYRLGKSRSGKTIYWMIDDLGICRDGHIGSSSHAADTWVSTLLKHRIPELAPYIPPSEHCLFGLHLLLQCASRKETQAGPLMVPAYLSVRATGGAVKPPHIGGGLEEVDVSFSSFLCAKEKDRMGLEGVSPLPPVSIVESERSAVILSEVFPDSLWLATAYAANLSERLLAPLQGHPVTLFPRTDDTMDTYLAWLEVADQAKRLYHLDITVDDTLEKHATPEQKARCIDLVDFIFENS